MKTLCMCFMLRFLILILPIFLPARTQVASATSAMKSVFWQEVQQKDAVSFPFLWNLSVALARAFLLGAALCAGLLALPARRWVFLNCGLGIYMNFFYGYRCMYPGINFLLWYGFGNTHETLMSKYANTWDGPPISYTAVQNHSFSWLAALR